MCMGEILGVDSLRDAQNAISEENEPVLHERTRFKYGKDGYEDVQIYRRVSMRERQSSTELQITQSLIDGNAIVAYSGADR